MGARLAALAGLAALGLFLARAPLTLCLALVLGATGGVLLLLHPALALFGLAFSVPFGSLAELSLGGFNLGASELLVAGMAAAWGLRSMATRRDALPPPLPLGEGRGEGEGEGRDARAGLTLALLVYLGTLLLSLLPAQELAPALKELAKWGEFLVVYLFVASRHGFETAPTRSGRGGDVRRYLVAALLLAGTLEGLLGIYQFLRQVGPPGFILLGRTMRAYGTFAQPNPFGGYMGLLLPLAYAIVLTQPRAAWRAWRERDPWPALLWLLALAASAAMGAALWMSWSRGALAGLAAGAALVVLALGRRVWLALALGALLLALVGPGATLPALGGAAGRFTDAFQYVGARDLSGIEITDENFAVIERAAHWSAAWRMFSAQPWLGVGAGQYAVVYPSVALPRWPDPLGHAHNIYLNVLAEGGLVGLAGYLGLIATALLLAWRAGPHPTLSPGERERQATQAAFAIRRARLQAAGRIPHPALSPGERGQWAAQAAGRGWEHALALGALGMLGHLVVHGLFDNLYVHGMYLLVAIILGMVRTVTRPDRSPPDLSGLRNSSSPIEAAWISS